MSELDSMKRRLLEEVDKLRDLLVETSLTIHKNPEVGFKEYKASALLARHLREQGFELEMPAASLETGFIATKRASRKGRRIAVLAEYDALPGIGHGCGHNLIATSALGAGLALGKIIEDTGGEVLVFGTPAEEGGWGKINFCEAGAFNNIDVALSSHPFAEGPIWASGFSTLAVEQMAFAFHGRPSHAAFAPYLGLNALDAVIQTYNSINALRQQLKDDVRIHGIITDGGEAPNIIPKYARASFYARSSDAGYLEEVVQRIVNCAKGAALATGTELRVELSSMLKNLISLKTLVRVFAWNCEYLGLKHFETSAVTPASTDVGNVSHVCPTVGFSFPITETQKLSFHTVEFAAAAATELAHKNMVLAAKLMALIGLDAVTIPLISEEAKKELDDILHKP